MSCTTTRNAIVTGGGSGIGEAVARELAARGYRVAVADRDAERAHAVADALEGDGFALELDVADARSVQAAAAIASTRLDGLDALVGAAGVEPSAPLGELSLAQWDLALATNLTGAFVCLRQWLGQLRARHGSALFVGSPAARAAYPGAAAYAASKAGLEGFVRAAAVDLAPDRVRVNAVVPGTTDTPMLRAAAAEAESSEQLVARAGAAVPLGRVAEAGEVAAVAGFLLSDAARYVTGACWEVDGGLLARLATDV